MAFNLFCLGTHIVYAPEENFLIKDMREDVKVQETLGAVAGYIKAAPEQKPNRLFENPADTDIHKLHDQAIVLDGADPFGTNIHNKIAKSVMLILNAILQGETDINLVGFSRGGVQIIHIAHELQRIQHELKRERNLTPESITRIICNMGHPSSKKHVQTYYSSYLSQLNKEHIDTLRTIFCEEKSPLRLKLFALDPVPGLCEGSYAMHALAWSSDRHFAVPPIVSHFKEVIQEDERSWGFRAILPTRVSSDTRMEIIHVPGHHGTADGNPFVQNPSKSKIDQTDPTPTRSVQLLVFYAILDFLHVDLVDAKPTAIQYLDDAFVAYKNATTPLLKLQLLYACYQDILLNKDKYREFRSYSFTNIEHQGNNERKIMGHLDPKDSKALSDYVDFNPEKNYQFINLEHVYITLELFLLSLSTPKVPCTLKMKLNLLHVMSHYLHDNPQEKVSLLFKNKNGLSQAMILDSLMSSLPNIVRDNQQKPNYPNEDTGLLIETITQLLATQPPRTTEQQAVLIRLKQELTLSIQKNIELRLRHANQFINNQFIHQQSLNFIEEAQAHYDNLVLLKHFHDELTQTRHIKLTKRIAAFPALCDQIIHEQNLKWPKKMNITEFSEHLKKLHNARIEKVDAPQPLKKVPMVKRPELKKELSFDIINGFATILGAIGVAVALTALILGTASLLSMGVLFITSTALLTYGLFGMSVKDKVEFNSAEKKSWTIPLNISYSGSASLS
ncbi:MAG: hypothetical protein ACOYKA_04920 [Legionellaceae bacterium]